MFHTVNIITFILLFTSSVLAQSSELINKPTYKPVIVTALGTTIAAGVSYAYESGLRPSDLSIERVTQSTFSALNTLKNISWANITENVSFAQSADFIKQTPYYIARFAQEKPITTACIAGGALVTFLALKHNLDKEELHHNMQVEKSDLDYDSEAETNKRNKRLQAAKASAVDYVSKNIYTDINKDDNIINQEKNHDKLAEQLALLATAEEELMLLELEEEVSLLEEEKKQIAIDVLQTTKEYVDLKTQREHRETDTNKTKVLLEKYVSSYEKNETIEGNFLFGEDIFEIVSTIEKVSKDSNWELEEDLAKAKQRIEKTIFKRWTFSSNELDQIDTTNDVKYIENIINDATEIENELENNKKDAEVNYIKNNKTLHSNILSTIQDAKQRANIRIPLLKQQTNNFLKQNQLFTKKQNLDKAIQSCLDPNNKYMNWMPLKDDPSKKVFVPTIEYIQNVISNLNEYEKLCDNESLKKNAQARVMSAIFTHTKIPNLEEAQKLTNNIDAARDHSLTAKNLIMLLQFEKNPIGKLVNNNTNFKNMLLLAIQKSKAIIDDILYKNLESWCKKFVNAEAQETQLILDYSYCAGRFDNNKKQQAQKLVCESITKKWKKTKSEVCKKIEHETKIENIDKYITEFNALSNALDQIKDANNKALQQSFQDILNAVNQCAATKKSQLNAASLLDEIKNTTSFAFENEKEKNIDQFSAQKNGNSNLYYEVLSGNFDWYTGTSIDDLYTSEKNTDLLRISSLKSDIKELYIRTKLIRENYRKICFQQKEIRNKQRIQTQNDKKDWVIIDKPEQQQTQNNDPTNTSNSEIQDMIAFFSKMNPNTNVGSTNDNATELKNLEEEIKLCQKNIKDSKKTFDDLLILQKRKKALEQKIKSECNNQLADNEGFTVISNEPNKENNVNNSESVDDDPYGLETFLSDQGLDTPEALEQNIIKATTPVASSDNNDLNETISPEQFTELNNTKNDAAPSKYVELALEINSKPKDGLNDMVDLSVKTSQEPELPTKIQQLYTQLEKLNKDIDTKKTQIKSSRSYDIQNIFSRELDNLLKQQQEINEEIKKLKEKSNNATSIQHGHRIEEEEVYNDEDNEDSTTS